MYEGVFPEYIEMMNPPVKVSEYVKSFSYMYGPQGFVSFWKFVKVQ